jgi:hypothetical protein
MTSEEASAFFYAAILQNAVSRNMIETFSKDFWSAKAREEEDALDNLCESVENAVGEGYRELKRESLETAQIADVNVVNHWIMNLVLGINGRQGTLGRVFPREIERAKSIVRHS